MMNALRFLRYSVRVIFSRGRHQASAWPRILDTLAAAAGGAVILTLPLWLILLGVV